MLRRPLGTTGLEISELSLGGAGLGGLYGEVSHDAGVATVLRAVDLGVNYVEASPFYGGFERTMGEALAVLGERAAAVRLCTKVGMHPARPDDYSGATARWSVEASLSILGVEVVDVVQVHAIDNIDMDVVLGPQGAVAELERLRSEGRVGAIGLAVRGAGYHRRAIASGRFDFLLVHDDFSLVRRTDSSLIAEAASAGLGVLVGRVLMTGLLAGVDPLEDPRLAAHPDAKSAHGWWLWARERELPIQAVALQFALRQPGVTSVVVGSSSPREIEQNVEAATFQLPDEIWHEVDAQLERSEAATD